MVEIKGMGSLYHCIIIATIIIIIFIIIEQWTSASAVPAQCFIHRFEKAPTFNYYKCIPQEKLGNYQAKLLTTRLEVITL